MVADEASAGSNADVFLTIYGELGDTGERQVRYIRAIRLGEKLVVVIERVSMGYQPTIDGSPPDI